MKDKSLKSAMEILQTVDLQDKILEQEKLINSLRQEIDSLDKEIIWLSNENGKLREKIWAFTGENPRV